MTDPREIRELIADAIWAVGDIDVVTRRDACLRDADAVLSALREAGLALVADQPVAWLYVGKTTGVRSLTGRRFHELDRAVRNETPLYALVGPEINEETKR